MKLLGATIVTAEDAAGPLPIRPKATTLSFLDEGVAVGSISTVKNDGGALRGQQYMVWAWGILARKRKSRMPQLDPARSAWRQHPRTARLFAGDDVWEHEPRASPHETTDFLSHFIQLGTSGCFSQKLNYTDELYSRAVHALRGLGRSMMGRANMP
ncbi:hypothetical protein BDA96_10G129500 [Sorghum bicolor]|uniref:Uncharacterized protein n=2 Tax=Sorghum bicolor TaxID=4558 RepID=A0A921Q1C9_SORBI|nr:hypothetical protein BDA96_10G129500 [Sorghum bicolor]KXG19722.1 hypothetical protein SORBI_3010G105900 [Sorghum bicolor]